MEKETLVIAPMVTEEYAQSEISTLVNMLDAELLLGADADSRNVMQKLQSRGDWSIVWFIAHGREEGIMLHDGEIDCRILTSFIRGARPELVVFNTCSSLNIAMDIHNEVQTNFVCTVTEVESKLAFGYASRFAANIVSGMSYYESYLDARPGQNRTFLFLGADNMMNRRASVSSSGGMNNNGEWSDLKVEVKRLSLIIDGDEKWNQRGLVPTMNLIQHQLEKIIQTYIVIRNVVFGLIVINMAILTFLLLFTRQ